MKAHTSTGIFRRHDAIEEQMIRAMMPATSAADKWRASRYDASINTPKTARTLTFRLAFKHEI